VSPTLNPDVDDERPFEQPRVRRRSIVLAAGVIAVVVAVALLALVVLAAVLVRVFEAIA
jgi:hypothetical protein